MTKKVFANLAQTDPDGFQRYQNNAHDIENEFDHVQRWIVINNAWETLKPWLLLGLATIMAFAIWKMWVKYQRPRPPLSLIL
jgi:hypothetical protein